MHILITGCGFLSYNLAKLLLKEDYCIHFVLKSMNVRLQELSLNFPTQVTFSSNRLDEVSSILKSTKFAAAVHLATNYGRSEQRSPNDIAEIVQDNIVFPIQLLRMINAVDIPLFINTDSYFNKEGLNYRKLLDYSLTKKSFNMWLSDKTLNTVVCTMRLEHAYGLYDKSEKFVSQAISEIALKKSAVFVATTGHQARDFVNAADIARSYKVVLEHQSIESLKFQILEIGSGKLTTIRSFLNFIKAISKSKTELAFGKLELHPDDSYDSYANLEKIARLGWSPKVSLDEGLNELISAAQGGKSWLF